MTSVERDLGMSYIQYNKTGMVLAARRDETMFQKKDRCGPKQEVLCMAVWLSYILDVGLPRKW